MEPLWSLIVGIFIGHIRGYGFYEGSGSQSFGFEVGAFAAVGFRVQDFGIAKPASE